MTTANADLPGNDGQPTLQAQRDRAEALHEWRQQPPIPVLPNAWDAASARVFERHRR